jgi:hypothetical protein
MILPASSALAKGGHGGGHSGGGGYGHSGGYGRHPGHNGTIIGGYGWGWGDYPGDYSSPYGTFPNNGGVSPVVPYGGIVDGGGFWISDGMTWHWVPVGGW